MSSVLKALKKAEKEKAKLSAPFIHSLKRTKTKKLSYNFIRSGLFTVLVLSFLCSLLYLYNFNNKNIKKVKQTGANLYSPQEASKKQPIEFSNNMDIKKASEKQHTFTSEQKISDNSVNQIQEKKNIAAPIETNTKNNNIAEPEPEPEEEENNVGSTFKSEPKPVNVVSTPKASTNKIELNMISWTHDPNERIAIINDSPMKEGEAKDGIKVLKINIKDVRIKQNNVEKVIKFNKQEDSDS